MSSGLCALVLQRKDHGSFLVQAAFGSVFGLDSTCALPLMEAAEPLTLSEKVTRLREQQRLLGAQKRAATAALNREARRLNRLKSTIAKLSQEDLKNCVELKVAATQARAKAQAKAKAKAKAKAAARPEVEG